MLYAEVILEMAIARRPPEEPRARERVNGTLHTPASCGGRRQERRALRSESRLDCAAVVLVVAQVERSGGSARFPLGGMTLSLSSSTPHLPHQLFTPHTASPASCSILHHLQS